MSATTTSHTLDRTYDVNASGALQRVLPLAGRLGLGAIFVLSGVGKIGDWNGTAGYMASKGMPAIPFFLAAAIAFELLGGVALIAGLRARLAAAALIVFLVPATLIFHNFWAYQGFDAHMQMIHFLKNVAIGGGLLTVVAHGAGPLSFDARK